MKAAPPSFSARTLGGTLRHGERRTPLTFDTAKQSPSRGKPRSSSETDGNPRFHSLVRGQRHHVASHGVRDRARRSRHQLCGGAAPWPKTPRYVGHLASRRMRARGELWVRVRWPRDRSLILLVRFRLLLLRLPVHTDHPRRGSRASHRVVLAPLTRNRASEPSHRAHVDACRILLPSEPRPAGNADRRGVGAVSLRGQRLPTCGTCRGADRRLARRDGAVHDKGGGSSCSSGTPDDVAHPIYRVAAERMKAPRDWTHDAAERLVVRRRCAAALVGGRGCWRRSRTRAGHARCRARRPTMRDPPPPRRLPAARAWLGGLCCISSLPLRYRSTRRLQDGVPRGRTSTAAPRRTAAGCSSRRLAHSAASPARRGSACACPPATINRATVAAEPPAMARKLDRPGRRGEARGGGAEQVEPAGVPLPLGAPLERSRREVRGRRHQGPRLLAAACQRQVPRDLRRPR